MFSTYAGVAFRLGMIHYGLGGAGAVADQPRQQADSLRPGEPGDNVDAKTDYRNFEALLLGVARFLWDTTPEALSHLCKRVFCIFAMRCGAKPAAAGQSVFLPEPTACCCCNGAASTSRVNFMCVFMWVLCRACVREYTHVYVLSSLPLARLRESCDDTTSAAGLQNHMASIAALITLFLLPCRSFAVDDWYWVVVVVVVVVAAVVCTRPRVRWGPINVCLSIQLQHSWRLCEDPLRQLAKIIPRRRP